MSLRLLACFISLALRSRAHTPLPCSASPPGRSPRSARSLASSVLLQRSAVRHDAGEVARQGVIGRGQRNQSTDLLTNQTEIWTRPHQGAGPEIVVFGLKLQKLHGLDFSQSHFVANLTLTLRWIDARAASSVLSQGGVLEAEAASKMMWLPNVQLKHPDLFDTEAIASVVSVAPGHPETIQQSMTVVSKLNLNLKTDLFPFDTQSFFLEVMPKKSVIEDLVLVPVSDASLSGADENAFSMSSFRFLSLSVVASTVGEGTALSSVGEVSIKIRRDVGAIMQNIMLPSITITMLSFVAFFFQVCRAAYIAPRIMVSVITVMLQLQLAREIGKMRPTGQTVWLDVFHESNTLLTFAAACLNTFVMATQFLGRHSVLAGLLDHEIRLFLPVLSMGLYVICLFSIGYDFALPLVFITRLVLGISLAVYLGGCIVRYQSWSGK